MSEELGNRADDEPLQSDGDIYAQTTGDPPPAEGDPPPVDDDPDAAAALDLGGDPPPNSANTDNNLEGDPPPN